MCGLPGEPGERGLEGLPKEGARATSIVLGVVAEVRCNTVGWRLVAVVKVGADTRFRFGWPVVDLCFVSRSRISLGSGLGSS